LSSFEVSVVTCWGGSGNAYVVSDSVGEALIGVISASIGF